jgi:hypothetical protein
MQYRNVAPQGALTACFCHIPSMAVAVYRWNLNIRSKSRKRSEDEGG